MPDLTAFAYGDIYSLHGHDPQVRAQLDREIASAAPGTGLLVTAAALMVVASLCVLALIT